MLIWTSQYLSAEFLWSHFVNVHKLYGCFQLTNEARTTLDKVCKEVIGSFVDFSFGDKGGEEEL